MFPTLKVLPGCTTQETAHVIDDYPYGIRLRCKIRYWLEYKRGNGFRLVSQTTNPKREYEIWNKAKASTYSMLAVMGLDAEGHVKQVGVGVYAFDDLAMFGAQYGAEFDEVQRGVYNAARATYERYQARRAAAAAKPDCEHCVSIETMTGAAICPIHGTAQEVADNA